MLIDTHAHIQFDAYRDDRDEVIERMRERGIIANVVGTQQTTSRRAVLLAEQHEFLYASIGTHPIHLHSTHVDEEETSFRSREEGFDEVYYEKLVQSPKVIGIGECGIDLYHLPHDIPKETVLAKQTEVFLDHLRFAEKYGLPMVIHCREAHDELLDILEGEGRPVRGTIHCYTGDWSHAKRYLALGLHLGFTGVVTFPPRKTDPQTQLDLLDVVRRMPLDRMLVETDSPYLAPQAYRGGRAEPWMVEEVVAKIAEIRSVTPEEIEQVIAENTLGLFDRIRLPERFTASL